MISYKGFNEKILTFPVSAKIDKGTFVKMGTNGCVQAVANAGNEDFIGVIIDCDTKYAAVQVSGYYEAPTSDQSITAGYNVLSATPKNIKANEDGAVYRLVIEVSNGTVKFII